MSWALYLSLTMTWAPEPSVEFEAGPYVYQEIAERSCAVEPLTLTWSPEDGFGASTRMTFGRATAQR